MSVKVGKAAASKIKKLKRYATYLGHTKARGFFVKVVHGTRKRPHRVLKVTKAAKAALGRRVVAVGLSGRRFTARVRHRSKRQLIVAAARWGVQHAASIHYSEAAIRTQALTQRFGKLPLTTDCSGFATYCYKAAGLPDPNGLGYRYLGYTGTLLAHAQKAGKILTDVSKALPGDLIVYGPGTGEHVAIIVEAGRDPLTVSHGQESEPAYVRVSQDGRQPQRICRYL